MSDLHGMPVASLTISDDGMSSDDAKDAQRYRWLREEAQYFAIGRAPSVVLCDEHDFIEKGKTPCEPDGWGFISGWKLDDAIDKAMRAALAAATQTEK